MSDNVSVGHMPRLEAICRGMTGSPMLCPTDKLVANIVMSAYAMVNIVLKGLDNGGGGIIYNAGRLHVASDRYIMTSLTVQHPAHSVCTGIL